VPQTNPPLPPAPRWITRVGALLILAGASAACAPNASEDPSGSAAQDSGAISYAVPTQPEMATGYQEKPGWRTSEFAVAAANPLATDAGFQVLEAGGTAVDAAIAVQLVLTLVEPQSSGIGGGAFLLHWNGDELSAWDGREVAPAAADENHFLQPDGTPLPFQQAMASGLSVGVPGTLAMLAVAHAAHGRLPWAELFTPAITLAEEGFLVSPRLHGLLEGDAHLRSDPLAQELYYDASGAARPVGYRLRNPALGAVLRQVAAEGISAFYQGEVASDIVARVQGHPERPGNLALADLAAYPDQDFRREPICTPWRVHTLCGFPPPSSGHLAVLQILGILEHLEGDAGPPPLEDGLPTADWLHLYLEAAKLAFADRNRYVGDARFVDPPAGSWESLLDPDYLASRAELVGDRSMGTAEAGAPGALATTAGRHPDQPDSGTSHISVVDADGNAVSMTTTIESAFGSRIMSDGGTGLPGGFHLNNELTDFSLAPRDAEGRTIANRVEAGKRPRSSMAPTLVFDRESGAFQASVGSPGGAAIIHYVAKALVGMYGWGLNAQDAIDLPNFTNANGASTLEAGRFPEHVLEALRLRGHELREGDLTSGIQAIQRLPGGGFFGGADPRREGVVMGR
jgi:gamma-glutamyltranspeptidase / glutathione hydrolase